MIRMPWTFGAPNVAGTFSPGWVHPVRTKSPRVFTPRVRAWRVEYGHARSDDPYGSGEE